MRTFSPVLAAISVRSSSIVLRLVLLGVEVLLVEQDARSPAHFFSWPSTIFSTTLSGLPSAFAFSSRISRSLLALLLGDVLGARRAGGSSR